MLIFATFLIVFRKFCGLKLVRYNTTYIIHPTSTKLKLFSQYHITDMLIAYLGFQDRRSSLILKSSSSSHLFGFLLSNIELPKEPLDPENDTDS